MVGRAGLLAGLGGLLENPILMKTQSSAQTWTWTLDLDLGFVNIFLLDMSSHEFNFLLKDSAVINQNVQQTNSQRKCQKMTVKHLLTRLPLLYSSFRKCSESN